VDWACATRRRAGRIGMVDVQILEFGCKRAIDDVLDARSRGPVEGVSIAIPEGLPMIIGVRIADRNAASHIGQEAPERVSEPQPRPGQSCSASTSVLWGSILYKGIFTWN
jgi:hypothetical protein